MSMARRAAAVSVLMKGLPVPAPKKDDPALLQVADGAAADEGFGDGLDHDGALGAGDHVGALEGVLKGDDVDDGGEHTGVVGGGAVHAPGGAILAAPDVSAADDDGELYAGLPGGLDLGGDVSDGSSVYAVADGAAEGFTTELQDDALVCACHGEATPARGRNE